MLTLKNNSLESKQKKVNYYDSTKIIPIWKHYKLEIKNVHSQVLQEVVKRVDLAFQAFFIRLDSVSIIYFPQSSPTIRNKMLSQLYFIDNNL
jgi:putative transposase